MLKQTLRVSLTLGIVGVTVLAAYALWQRNFYSPWTIDARVRADIIELKLRSGEMFRRKQLNRHVISAEEQD